jgi:hypothetical protein
VLLLDLVLVVSTLQFVGPPPPTQLLLQSLHACFLIGVSHLSLLWLSVSSDCECEFRERVEFACCEEDCCPLVRVGITQVGACRSTDLNHARLGRIECQ